MTTTLEELSVERLCEKIKQGEVSEGERFIVHGSLTPSSVTEEVVFCVKSGCADTLISRIGRIQITQGPVQEIRYTGEGGYCVFLDSHDRKSRDYHNLLEA